MNIADLKRPVLRDRNLLEEQIGAEIALGALASLDDAIEHNHEAALEYGAQILFDNVRKKIAQQSNLPQHIVCHLFFDRNPEIQKIILQKHFPSLPQDYQDTYLEEAINKLNSTDKDPDDYYNSSMPDKNQLRNYKEILTQIRKKAIKNEDDILAAKLSRVKFIVNYSTCREFSTDLGDLRKLPETVKECYTIMQTNKWKRQEVAVTHPDENIRIAAIKDVIKMSATELREVFPSYAERIKQTVYNGRGHQVYKGDIKKAVYLALADDPSPVVISILVNNIMHKEVLMILAEKYAATNPRLSQIAKHRGIQITLRSNYSKAYQERRRNGQQNGMSSSSTPTPEQAG